MAGPPFTGLETALAGIAAGEPTGLVFYAVAEPPHTERVAIRRLTAPSITTSLVLPSGQRPPASATCSPPPRQPPGSGIASPRRHTHRETPPEALPNWVLRHVEENCILMFDVS